MITLPPSSTLVQIYAVLYERRQFVQLALASAERHSFPVANPTEFDSEALAEEASEGESDRRSLGIPAHVIPQAAPQRLSARQLAIRRRSLRPMPM
jgi:hypothetical protein